MSFYFKDTEQISEMITYKYEPPIYDKSTTDPTYYEPQATRIANMRKSAGSTVGVYDFEGETAKKFADEKNALLNLSSAEVDPRFNNHLLREEISQITNDKMDSVQNMLSEKKERSKKKEENLAEQVKIAETIQNKTTQNQNDSE